MKKAEKNLEALRGNAYPGRGLVIGLDEDGRHLVQVYWIMGRSANSRNRVFVADGPTLRTEPADASKVEDPSLIIYNAMSEFEGTCIVTNGNQTDTIYDALAGGVTFAGALETREYEPDAPNFTPRISGISIIEDGTVNTYLSVLKKSPFADACVRNTFQYEALPTGAGYTITTYTGDGAPLPSFEGEPYLLPLAGTPGEIAQDLWEALDADNRISLAVKAVNLETGVSIIEVTNAYEQATA
ncbi:MAG: inosine monophosphate cyclohydrolase [Planctomycetes bacterium]|nr:inosine monophosphate cyclohydrolase [Planctomycetota bacterium]